MASLFPAPLTWRGAGLLAVACGVLLLALALLIDGGPSKYIHIRWRPGVNDARRGELESRFGLRERVRDGRSFGYDLVDLFSSNVRAIITDPAVEDTADLDIRQFVVASAAGDGRARSGLAWRWGIERVIGPIRQAGVALLLAGVAALLVSWVRIPDLSPRSFGAFRVVFALVLLGIVWSGDVRATAIQLQRPLGIPGVEWLRPLAGQAPLVEALRWVLTATAVLFGAGVYARVAFGAFTLAFLTWCGIWGMSMSSHPLGPLPLGLVALVVAPWQDGVGVDRWRAGREARPSRVPRGYGPWVLCLALAVGFCAAAFAKVRGGPDWIVNGTVRYHFMAEALTASKVSWGPWIAARLWLSIALSLLTVTGEAVMVAALFVGPRWRLMLGLTAAALLAGFGLFHGAVWPAWWALLLGFLPWEWLNDRTAPVASSVKTPLRVPVYAVVLVVLLVAQQVAVSVWIVREIPPFASVYDMYSETFSSPEEFEAESNIPRFAVLADTLERPFDVADCVRRDREAIADMEAALRTRAVPGAHARDVVVRCASGIPGANSVRVLADKRGFDWVNGRTWYEFRDFELANWPM